MSAHELGDETRPAFAVADAYDDDHQTPYTVHRCLRCYALVLASDVSEHTAWHEIIRLALKGRS